MAWAEWANANEDQPPCEDAIMVGFSRRELDIIRSRSSGEEDEPETFARLTEEALQEKGGDDVPGSFKLATGLFLLSALAMLVLLIRSFLGSSPVTAMSATAESISTHTYVDVVDHVRLTHQLGLEAPWKIDDLLSLWALVDSGALDGSDAERDSARRALIGSLVRYPSPEMMEFMEALEGDPDPSVAECAKEAHAYIKLKLGD